MNAGPRNARIIATGMHAPDRVVPNSWFDQHLGEDVGTWLVENLTIRERRWCADGREHGRPGGGAPPGPCSSGRAWQPADLDLIIVATDTPEFVSPSTAAVVQDRLGATGAGSFDLNTACAGFVTALDAGAKYIRADRRYRNVLVIGAYAMSRHLDLDDKKTVTLFADGAAGVVLQAHDGPAGWQAARLHTEGQYHGWMGIYAGGARTPVTPEVLAAGDHKLRFVKKFPKEINPTTWTAHGHRDGGRRRPHGRRHRPDLLHADQHQQHPRDHGQPGSAPGADPLRHGPLRLHRLGLHPHVPGRGRRPGQAAPKATSWSSWARAAGWPSPAPPSPGNDGGWDCRRPRHPGWSPRVGPWWSSMPR